MDSDTLQKALALGFQHGDYNDFKDIPEVFTNTPNLAPPKFTDKDYDYYVKLHQKDTPFAQVNCGFERAGYTKPKLEYEKESDTGFWVCRLHDGAKIHVGYSRDKRTATQVAATHILDDAIEAGRSERFFLPKNVYEAKGCVAAKRKMFLKLAEENMNPNAYAVIHEYAQFMKTNIKSKANEKGPPFTNTIEFDGKIYVSKACASKKEAQKDAAAIVYQMLIETNKYADYLKKKEIAAAAKKLKTDKYRVSTSQKTNFGSQD